MKPGLRIYLIAGTSSLASQMEIRLQSKGHQVFTLEGFCNLIGFAYNDPPDLFILDISEGDEVTFSIIRELKGDSFFSVVPIIGLMSESMARSFDWAETPLDDFIFLPVSYPELFSRIDLAVQRIRRVFDNNALTRLPGNTSIQHAVERVIGKPMAICHVDINHFKPYNDVYGFSHGDEVLRMLARIIFNSVKESGGGFTGHIGGDDFVFIVPIERAEQVSQEIIRNFTAIIADLFGEQEKTCGYYIGYNRRGQKEQIPLLGLAIGIVHGNNPNIRHYGKVAEVAAELKAFAKKSESSCYVVDKRTSPERAAKVEE